MRYRMRRLCIAICLCSLCALGWGLVLRDTPASAANDLAYHTLQKLGVTDAVFVEQAEDPRESTGEYLLYTSDETQTGYYFDAETGRLTRVKHYSMMGIETQGTATENANRVDVQSVNEGNQHEVLLEFAAACLSPDLIGELELENTNGENGDFQSYTITEYYNGMPTGSSVMVDCVDGMVYWSLITTGEIFTKDEKGNVILANGEEWMSEDEILAIVSAYTEENPVKEAAEVRFEEANCKLEAHGDVLSYLVEMPFLDEQGRARTYALRINAYTGEIIRAMISM